jgi:predicted dehydrogenase
MLRTAVIGLGVGEQHIVGYEADSRCIVTTLCDLDKKKLVKVASRHPGKRLVLDAEKVLADPNIDVVSIASYEDAHCDQVVAAVESGKHVFVEKPLCLTLRELERIVQAVKSNPKVKLSSNLILRKTPRFMELKRQVVTGCLGNLYYMEGDYDYGRLPKITDGWRGRIPNYSVVHGGGIHLIDLLCWLHGDEVEEVFAYGNKTFSQECTFLGSDLVVALLRFRNGLIAKISANFGCVAPHFHRLSIYGSAGTFQQGHSGASYIFSRDPKKTPIVVSDEYPGSTKGDMLPAFVKSILDGSPPDVTAQEVIDVMSVSLAIERSVSTGLPERVRYFPLGREQPEPEFQIATNP